MTQGKNMLYRGGPGSGRTSCLVKSASALLRDGGIEPGRILILGPLAGSVEGMRRALQPLLDDPYRARTLHSFADYILRKHFREAGLPVNYQVVSNYKRRCILENVLHGNNPGGWPLREVSSIIGSLKRSNLGPEDVLRRSAENRNLELLAGVYLDYDSVLREAREIDIDAIISAACRLLAEHGAIAEENRPGALFIDDVDELSPAGYDLLLQLGKEALVIGAGNPFAPSAVMLRRFEDDFAPQVRDLDGEGYHSRVRIDAISKPLLVFERDIGDEAEFISREIKRIVAEDVSFGDIAVVCRGGTEVYAELFRHHRIPYLVKGGSLADWAYAAGAVYHYLRALTGEDEVESFGVAAKRMAGPGLDRMKITAVALLNEVMEAAIEGEANESMEEFMRHFRSFKEDSSDPLAAAVAALFSRGLMGGLMAEEGEPDAFCEAAVFRRSSAVSGLMRVIGDFHAARLMFGKGPPSMTELIGRVKAEMATPSPLSLPETANPAAVIISDPAGVMGESFKVVFVVGLDECSFPAPFRPSFVISASEVDILGGGRSRYRPHRPLMFGAHAERERWLFSLAVSRARERLYLTRHESKEGGARREPSPFWRELLPDGRSIEYPYSRGKREGIGLAQAYTPPEISALVRMHLTAAGKADGEGAGRMRVRLGEVLPPSEARRWILHRLDLPLPEEALAEQPIKIESDRSISPTALNTFLSCPRKFFYRYIARLKPPMGFAARIGILGHAVLKEFHENHPSLEGEDFDGLWSEMEKLLKGVISSSPVLENPMERRVAVASIGTFLNPYLKGEIQRQGLERVRTVAVEKAFDYPLDGYRIEGRIDRVDRRDTGYEIIDYKFSSSYDTELAIKKKFLNLDGRDDYQPENFQLPLYYFAALALGLSPRAFSFYYLKNLARSGAFAGCPRKRSLTFIGGGGASGPKELAEEEMAIARAQIIRTIDRLMDGVYPREPLDERRCRRCDYRFLCDKAEDDNE